MSHRTKPRSYIVICNPTAGKGKALRKAERIRDLLIGQDHDVAIKPTMAHGDAERLVAESVADASPDDPIGVIACGGDGTIQQAANAIMNTGSDRAVLGLAPSGRCNDFARALGISRPFASIADALVNGEPRPVDLGRMNDRYFCSIAAVGFDAVVTRYVNDMSMPLRGTASYIYGALRVLMTYRTPQLRITGEFGEYVGPVFMLSTANTACYGGALRIAPDASPTDGMFDICLVSAIAKIKVVALIPRVLTAAHTRLPQVAMHKSRSLTITGVRIDDPVAEEVWADGEFIGKLPATIDIVPDAIRVIQPTRTT